MISPGEAAPILRWIQIMPGFDAARAHVLGEGGERQRLLHTLGNGCPCAMTANQRAITDQPSIALLHRVRETP